jgi:hypothetical protein
LTLPWCLTPHFLQVVIRTLPYVSSHYTYLSNFVCGLDFHLIGLHHLHMQVIQGVRQGGILSTDLYKLYNNPLLARLESANIGMGIGNISTNCTACADDVALLSGKPDHTQILRNMCNDYDICPAHLIELSAFSCRLLIRTQCLSSIPLNIPFFPRDYE